MDDRSGDRRGGRDDGDRGREGPGRGPPETDWLDLEVGKVIAGRAEALTRTATEELLKDAIKARIRERLGARLDAVARVAADAFVDDIEASLAVESTIGARREARRSVDARFAEAIRGVPAAAPEGEGGPPGERTEGGWDPRRV